MGMIHVTPRPWMENANCLTEDPELFFPDETDPYAVRVAKQICAGCPLATRTACTEYAIEIDATPGVYGGLTRRQRLHLARKAQTA